jgi:septum formation protein
MADTLTDRLDGIIDVLVARGDASGALRDAELAPLARVAADLRHCPDREFTARLRAQLERRTTMATALEGPAKAGHYVRESVVRESVVRESEVRQSEVRQSEVVSGFSRTVVLGADTAVVIEGQILGKPQNDLEAASTLRQLSGRAHEVLTGISLRAEGLERGRVETTVVEFSPLTEADIAWYVASGEGRDKAGGYAIQGLASRFIPRIRGSYSNVVGLPMAAVHELAAEIASGPQSALF